MKENHIKEFIKIFWRVSDLYKELRELDWGIKEVRDTYYSLYRDIVRIQTKLLVLAENKGIDLSRWHLNEDEEVTQIPSEVADERN